MSALIEPAANRDGSPAIAYRDNSEHKSTTDSDAPVIAVRRGEAGYWPIHTTFTADELNQDIGVTPAIREAMYAGSMFGWDKPAADPANYDADGNLLRSRLHAHSSTCDEQH